VSFYYTTFAQEIETFVRNMPITPENTYEWFKAYFSLRYFNDTCSKILRAAYIVLLLLLLLLLFFLAFSLSPIGGSGE